MKNFTPYSTQHLFNFLKKAELLLQIGRKDFLKNLKKDLYFSKKIEVIKWEVNTLYGAGSYEANRAEQDRIMLYLKELVVLYLEYPHKNVFNEDIHFVFNMVDSMYLEFKKLGKLDL